MGAISSLFSFLSKFYLLSCLSVSSSFPLMPRQIDVWAVSNKTFVLLSNTLLHSTTEFPFIVLAFYSLRSETLKRVNGDATRALCRLRKYLSEALYISFQAIKDVRSHIYLLCNVILFVGCTKCVASCFVFMLNLRNVCSLVSGFPI